MYKIFIFGYPGGMGGANTEAWHLIKLLRNHDVDVHLIPTWGSDDKWLTKLNNIGCVTHHIQKSELLSIKELHNAITIGICNNEYIAIAEELKSIRCKIIWVNCMTFMFDTEKELFKKQPADVMIYQSNFQKSILESELVKITNYDNSTGHLIRGAFDIDSLEFKPRPHHKGGDFYIGKLARPDSDKWPSNLWDIYNQIAYQNKCGLVMGVNADTLSKLGRPPPWIKALFPMTIPVDKFLNMLHCMLTINGGARENWPRVGLEAMATGVPIVTNNKWGWQEMIEHNETGFLADTQSELIYYTTELANNENLRLKIISNARHRLISKLANHNVIWRKWENIFRSLS